MNAKTWTTEEKNILESLRLDPIRTDRVKLTALAVHFYKGGGIWSISEGGKLSVNVSRGLARKVRDLVSGQKLDWLLQTEADLGGISKDYTPSLCILSPSVDIWTDGVSIAKYACVEVSVVSNVEAKDCWAWVEVMHQCISLPLHWAGTQCTAEETSAPRIIISPSKPARLDVAVALPLPNKAPSNFEHAKVCGDVPMYVLGSRYGEQIWNGEGCWLAQPLALYNPTPELESFLPPDKYKIKVRVGCDMYREVSCKFILLSPRSWEELKLV